LLENGFITASPFPPWHFVNKHWNVKQFSYKFVDKPVDPPPVMNAAFAPNYDYDHLLSSPV